MHIQVSISALDRTLGVLELTRAFVRALMVVVGTCARAQQGCDRAHSGERLLRAVVGACARAQHGCARAHSGERG
jgi:hypothetical protein